MRIDIQAQDDRQLRALTGLSKSEFVKLSVPFSEIFQELKQKRYEENIEFFKRKPGNGAKGKLETIDEKLFFILYYLKVYPSYDVLGFPFGMKGKNAHKNVVKLLKVLEATLRKLEVLPKREFKTEAEFKSFMKKYKEIIIDATERAHHRKQDQQEQKKYYNGKKNDIL